MKVFQLTFSFLTGLIFISLQSFAGRSWSEFDEKDYAEQIQYLALLDSAGLGKNVFMIGEKHNHPKTNAHIQFEFVKYLHQQHGVQDILLEFGHITGFFANRFAYLNDTSVNEILNELPDKHYKIFYNNVREYNLEQPEEKRIRIHGVDAQKTEIFIFYALDWLMKDKAIAAASDSIQLHLEAIHMEAGRVEENQDDEEEEMDESEEEKENTNRPAWKYFDDPFYNFYSSSTMDEVYENMQNHLQAYKDFYGKDSSFFMTVYKSIPEYMDYGRYREESHSYYSVQRERIMMQKMLDIHQEDTSRKYFAEFGKCHVATLFSENYCNRKNFTPFADRIRKEQQFSPLIFAISYNLEEDQEFYSTKFKSQYLKTSEDSIALYRYDTTSATYTLPDFIIVAAMESKAERENVVEEEVFRKSNRKKVHVNFNFITGFKPFEEGAFSFNYGPGEKLFFPEAPLAYGGGITIFEDRDPYVSIEGLSFQGTEKTVADTMNANFNAFQFSLQLGRELTKSNLFNITPYFGFTFIRSVIELAPIVPNNYLTQPDLNQQITSNGLLPEAGLDLNLTLKFFNLGVKGGYQLDISPKGWSGAPTSYNTSYSGWYAWAYLGLTILD